MNCLVREINISETNTGEIFFYKEEIIFYKGDTRDRGNFFEVMLAAR